MKIARFASYALAGLSVLFALSCTKNKEEEKPASEASSAKFKVALNLVESNRAEVIVRHDGKDSDTWFGFITDDIETPEADLIQGQLPNVSKSTLHVGATQTVEVKNLEEYSKYRYIAFGVTEDKELFGTPGSLVFSTNPDLDAKFAVEVSAVTSSSAKASVTMEGKSYLTYYVAISEDTTSSDAEIAAAAYSDIVKDGDLLEGVKLLTGASNELSFETLKADTQYSVVAFGVFVDEEGSALYYGTPAVAKFATTPDYSKVAFSATPVTVGKNIAKFNVTYDTASEMSWYAFVTKDTEATASSLISAAVEGITAENWNKGEGEVTFEELQAMTKYSIIVTGIKEDGIFGVPADVTFMTTDEDYDEIVFTAQLVEAEKNSATIKVSNSTANDVLRWTYVVTTDLTKEAAQLLPAAADVAPENVYSGNDKEFTVTGLNGGTVYRVIVAGYREDDNNDKYIYGAPADLQFNTASAYTVNEAWVLQYNGKQIASSWGQWALYLGIHNTGAKLDVKIYTKEAFDAAGIVDPLINAAVEEGKALLATLGEGETIDDITWTDNETETQSWLFDSPLDPGDYVAIIYDVDDNFNALGSYQKAEYTIAASTATADYNAWLGMWINGADIWNVEAGIPGETYIITGILSATDQKGNPLKTTATFDPSTKQMYFYRQSVGGFQHQSYGACSIDLVGWFDYSGSTYYLSGHTKIASASLNADGSATITPSNAGSYGTYKEMSFYWVILEGENAGLGNNYSSTRVALPGTLERVSNTGSDAYNAWLGTWSIPRNGATDTWVISQNVANVSYTITGVEGLTDREVEAKFISSTGGISVSTQENLKSYKEGNYNVQDHLYGRILYNNNEVYVTGSYDLFTGAISGNTATLTPGSVTITGGVSYDLIGMTVYAWDADANQVLGSYLEEGEDFTRLPNTLTKVSGNTSSVKSVSKLVRKAGGREVSAARSEVLNRGLKSNTKAVTLY